MKEQALNEFARNFLAVIAGVVAAIIVATILFPLLQTKLRMSGDSDLVYLLYYQDKRTTLGIIFVFGWLFIASLVGGIVCTWLSASHEMIYVLINSLVSIVIIFVLSTDSLWNNEQLITTLIMLVSIPIGNVIGGWIMARLKPNQSAR